MSERLSKKWWVVNDGSVTRETGYSCAPGSPDFWWFPKIGLSISEGSHLFEEEKPAVEKAIKEVESTVKKWTDVLYKLAAKIDKQK